MIAEKSNSSTHNDLPESWRWEYDGDCPRAVNDAGGIISGHGRQWVIDTAWESNSSAPLTGWTRDWPTADGWWFVCRAVDDESSPAFVYVDADGEWHAHETGVHWSKADGHRLLFHPMAQPPEPPKDTP